MCWTFGTYGAKEKPIRNLAGKLEGKRLLVSFGHRRKDHIEFLNVLFERLWTRFISVKVWTTVLLFCTGK
jgi:hypothetical protein